MVVVVDGVVGHTVVATGEVEGTGEAVMEEVTEEEVTEEEVTEEVTEEVAVEEVVTEEVVAATKDLEMHRGDDPPLASARADTLCKLPRSL